MGVLPKQFIKQEEVENHYLKVLILLNGLYM